MFEQSIQIKDTSTGKLYKLVPEEVEVGCTGCAFINDVALCSEAPNYCGESRSIWKEVE